MNTDRRISAKEMQKWIMQKTVEHFQEAVAESRAHFRAVDPDGDGMGSPWPDPEGPEAAGRGQLMGRSGAPGRGRGWPLAVQMRIPQLGSGMKLEAGTLLLLPL